MKVQVEYTDTFGGEANYSWVNRAEFDLDENTTDKQLKRAAKKALDMEGVRGVWENWGDTLAFRPRGSCTILFVTRLLA